METNLAKMRKVKGMTQKELAAKACIGASTLRCYEAGERNVNNASALIVLRLANALGCQVSDILELEIPIFSDGWSGIAKLGDNEIIFDDAENVWEFHEANLVKAWNDLLFRRDEDGKVDVTYLESEGYDEE